MIYSDTHTHTHTHTHYQTSRRSVYVCIQPPPNYSRHAIKNNRCTLQPQHVHHITRLDQCPHSKNLVTTHKDACCNGLVDDIKQNRKKVVANVFHTEFTPTATVRKPGTLNINRSSFLGTVSNKSSGQKLTSTGKKNEGWGGRWHPCYDIASSFETSLPSHRCHRHFTENFTIAMERCHHDYGTLTHRFHRHYTGNFTMAMGHRHIATIAIPLRISQSYSTLTHHCHRHFTENSTRLWDTTHRCHRHFTENSTRLWDTDTPLPSPFHWEPHYSYGTLSLLTPLPSPFH